MEIRELALNELQTVVDFSWRQCEENANISYPLHDTKEKMFHYFEKSFREKDRTLLVICENTKLVGLLGYFWIAEEEYLEVNALYVEEGRKEIIFAAIKMLEETYPGYHIDIGVAHSFSIAMECFKKMGFELVQDSEDLYLELNNLEKKLARDSHVKKIQYPSQTNKYLAFHKQKFDQGGGYWTSEKMAEHLNLFDIYVYEQDKKIVGAVFCRYYGDNVKHAEVYGRSTEKIEQEKALLEYAILDLKEIYPNILRLSDMPDSDEIETIAIEQELGFVRKNRYCCWSK